MTLSLSRPLAALALAATLAAAAGPAAAFDPAAMSAEDRAAFDAAVRDYLLRNPEVLLEAIDILNARQAAAQAEADARLVAANAGALYDDGFSWVGGNPEGDVTLVEFIDYRCGVCRRANPDVWSLVEGDGNIRIVVKEFPILGPESELSSRFAIATLQLAGPDAYERAYRGLIELRASVNPASLTRLGEALGLDTPAILARMQAPEVTRVIEETRALALRLQITGTPTFVFGDRMVRGLVPLADMQRLVAEVRAN
jgi:protein-disulfide isomerase